MTGGKIRLFLIEDQELVRFGLTAALPKHNPKIEVISEAETGEKGLALLQTRKLDVAIVDFLVFTPSPFTLMYKVMLIGSSGFSMLVLLDLTSFPSFQPCHTAPKCLSQTFAYRIL